MGIYQTVHIPSNRGSVGAFSCFTNTSLSFKFFDLYNSVTVSLRPLLSKEFLAWEKCSSFKMIDEISPLELCHFFISISICKAFALYTSVPCHFVSYSNFAISHVVIINKLSIQYFRIELLQANQHLRKKPSDDKSVLQSGRFVTWQVMIGIDNHTLYMWCHGNGWFYLKIVFPLNIIEVYT